MATFACVLGTLLVTAATAVGEEGVVRDEELNFEIRLPRYSVDWKIVEIPADVKKQGRQAHLQTKYKDSDPLATADVVLSVTPMSKDLVHNGPPRIAQRWKDAMEAHLSNPRDRTEEAVKLGGVDAWRVDVRGDYLAGIHRRTWYVAKNGRYVYLLYIDRNYEAVEDEMLDEELREILDSFKFMRIEKEETNKEAGGADGGPAGVGGPGAEPAPDEIDPELLKKQTFREPFWRFSCVKPEGLLKLDLEESESQNDCKYRFQNDKEGSRLLIRIYAQTDRAKRYTLEQLLESKIKYFSEEVKEAKEPEIDKRYKFPLADDAVRVEMVGRGRMTIRRVWILVDCKNERQYQIEIYVTGTTGMQLWGREIDEFLKNFKPQKR